jgi:hypothetical protein
MIEPVGEAVDNAVPDLWINLCTNTLPTTTPRSCGARAARLSVSDVG